MKIPSIRLVTIVLVIAVCPTLTVPALADGEVRLRLSANVFDVEEGQEFTVDVLIENAPEVYGIDVQLGFDPAVLQVVDADQSANGIQLADGTFFDASQSYFLENTADNTNGTIDLAMTLLNPAPPAKGDGLLARVTFKAVSAGHTTIAIRDGLFGTRTGETIAPQFENNETSASDISNAAGVPNGSEAQAVAVGSSAGSQTGSEVASIAGMSVDMLRIIGLAALLAAGVAIGLFLGRRRPKRTDR
ncbi:MAG: hypothetical protein JXB07_20430 [Anaerolineae bacterium]|nr:hypothetical protein [Anaerolineae bacterium]